MAGFIRTPIKIKYYDNWAGFLMYLSACGIATFGLGLIMNYQIMGTESYDELVALFITTIIATFIFGIISREIATKKSSNSHNKGPFVNSSSSKAKQGNYDNYPYHNKNTLIEAESDERIRENIKKGIIHL